MKRAYGWMGCSGMGTRNGIFWHAGLGQNSGMNISCLIVLVACGAAIVFLIMQLMRERDECSSLQKQVSDLKNTESTLRTQAYFDLLTGLANLTLFSDRFRLALERSKRSQKPFSVLLIDLNDFKHFRDSHGHAAEDAVLRAIGKRLVETVRASDTVARLGGYQFAVLAELIEKRAELELVSLKLSNALAEGFVLDSGAVVMVKNSIGFAQYPMDGSDLESMLVAANHAMVGTAP
jgi:diguanylate cyclase (GGDEF)-like protein